MYLLCIMCMHERCWGKGVHGVHEGALLAQAGSS